MSIIVQKFGGTSVATPKSRQALLNQVIKCKNEGKDVVLVVSAMGRVGDPYATDTLIGMMEEVNENISPRKKDLLVSCGEVISCSVISHLLESNNIASEPLNGYQAGITTTNVFSNSEIINIDTAKINKHLKEGKVVVIAGFQGVTKEGEITTLGRGGSDTSSVSIGGYLNAERVDIFTDVIGIAKADPRVVPSAEYMSSISYENIFKLADNGAKVIHPRAVKAAQDFNIPVRVRSTFSDDPGTLITGEESTQDHKIIGFALEKDVESWKVFIAFDKNRKKEVKDDIESFIKEYGTSPISSKWGNGDVTLVFAKDNITEIVQNLYFHLNGEKKSSDIV